MKSLLRLAAACACVSIAAHASAADLGAVNRINDQAFNHSQVLQTAAHLTDGIGGRLTNSPAMRKAEAWTQGKFREWGLAHVHTEGFEFGRGWWIENSRVRMTAPRPIELRAIPVAWTPATNGPLAAPVIVAPMSRERDFAEWRGKLAGKIVLVTWPGPPKDATEPAFKRQTGEELTQNSAYRQPAHDPDELDRYLENRGFAAKLDAFLKAEGALAWGRMSYREGGLVHGAGYLHQVGATAALPGVEIAAEDYRRLARLAKLGPVTLEIDSKVHFDDSDTRAYNVFAEIPGRDPKAGYVMAGAHLDSWVAADGATDNAAGSAVVMEAARILKTLGVKPKRTIRFALWSGEEQGLLGSAAYVDRHLARRPPHSDPAKRAWTLPVVTQSTYPVTPLPGFKDMAGYFNLDNGSGKIRGVYTEGNMAAAPVLKEWLAPYATLGATTVSARPTGGTDHVYMARLGLPAYQFIQDGLDYSSTTHHSNVDTYDHLRPEDLKQASAVMAWMLLQAADADAPLPSNVLPTEPVPADPFAYPDPSKR
ncbi:M20/M25/M40 family metallo-hydrolase [Phenylobacterium deserti]|uniref:Carboxypeptidase Q n=1 Tax=Phenylobacterium deserti TaxID=1914756 RepID=A0A328AQD9_9CAUL|nr:M20/M25/M40 family metallo-hydrolase [Phenylobacterium deserti]RAK56807.1 peptidase M28 [Phenylobacterium deserti]